MLFKCTTKNMLEQKGEKPKITRTKIVKIHNYKIGKNDNEKVQTLSTCI